MIDFRMETEEHKRRLLEGNRGDRMRVEFYRRFIDENLADSKVLDVGELNWVGQQLAPHATNTYNHTDFNYSVRAPKGYYDVMLCFEVLEHVFNTLDFLVSLRQFSRIMYLSTPLLSPFGMLNSEIHVTEYRPEVLREMFRLSGWDILKEGRANLFPWYTVNGIRPLIRALTFRIGVFKLEQSVVAWSTGVSGGK